jgi:holliday junction DNA helicase RuvA
MYEYIKGKNTESSPTYVVIETNGIGYFVNISLHTYSQINQIQDIKLFVHENIREDAYSLYGFFDKAERDIFRHLINVSGIGANTARMMLSSMNPAEIHAAIVTDNVNLLKGVKGIGLKTAQRIIVDLKDKLSKEPISDKLLLGINNTIREEALSALVMLGFTKSNSQKAVDKILSDDSSLKVEMVIKQALKML